MFLKKWVFRGHQCITNTSCFFFSFQILSNLLEIVKDRAETAEDELDRIITEINESQDSPVSSEKSLSIANPSVRVSDGSDEVFDGSSSEKSQSTVVWEVRSHLTESQTVYLFISFTKQRNFGLDQIESNCRRQI